MSSLVKLLYQVVRMTQVHFIKRQQEPEEAAAWVLTNSLLGSGNATATLPSTLARIELPVSAYRQQAEVATLRSSGLGRGHSHRNGGQRLR